jgi:hypothetical protein
MKTPTAISPIDAIAKSWASMDGKLTQTGGIRSGYRDGYYADAQELLRRAEKRGFIMVTKGET